MSLTLRAYTPDDFDKLHAIDQACYPSGIAYSKQTLRWFLRLPGAECVVAELEDKIAGFILAQQEGPNGAASARPCSIYWSTASPLAELGR